MRRALKPGGVFFGAMLGAGTLQELRDSFFIAESSTRTGVSPRVAPFADVRDAGALLQRAGFSRPVADLDRKIVRYATPFDLFRDLRGMGFTNALHDRSRAPLTRATLKRAADAYATRFGDPDGRVRASFVVIFLYGVA
jgi:hypothetical protein